MDQYINIFAPPPLGMTHFSGDIKYVQNLVKQQHFVDNGHGEWNSISSNRWILDIPEFIDIKNFINNSIQEYIEKVFRVDHKVDIMQSWSTITNKDEEHPLHFHANSYLSGVFFVKSSLDSPPFVLHNNIKVPSISLDLFNGGNPNLPPNEFNNVIRPTYSIDPIEGRLVLFPSLTPHFVPKSNSNQERIVIAFNTFPKIPFGCEFETNHVISRS